jgi:hypothetical protein
VTTISSASAADCAKAGVANAIPMPNAKKLAERPNMARDTVNPEVCIPHPLKYDAKTRALHLTPISKEPAWFSAQVRHRIIEGNSKRTALHIRIQNVMLEVVSARTA